MTSIGDEQQMGLVRENVYLCDLQVSICLVDEYADCNCFKEVSFLILMKVSKWNEEHHQVLRKIK
jgi:hypothetical protein